MARYDWLVDFGDAAPQIPSRYQQPTPAGRLHRHLIRPVIADDLPAGASIGSVDTSTVFLPSGVSCQPRLAAHAMPKSHCLGGHIYLTLQFLLPLKWDVSLEGVA
jgi:hypothetical protein